MNWYKTAIRQKSVKQIAQEVRNVQVKSYDSKYLEDHCLPVSRALRDALVRNGHNSIVVQGNFRVDESVDINEDVEPGTEKIELTEEDNRMRFHYWVEILVNPDESKNIIVDLTATQFQKEVPSDTLESITIGTYIELDRYIPIHRGWN